MWWKEFFILYFESSWESNTMIHIEFSHLFSSLSSSEPHRSIKSDMRESARGNKIFSQTFSSLFSFFLAFSLETRIRNLCEDVMGVELSERFLKLWWCGFFTLEGNEIRQRTWITFFYRNLRQNKLFFVVIKFWLTIPENETRTHSDGCKKFGDCSRLSNLTAKVVLLISNSFLFSSF